jgi:hypothetical protein
VRRSGFEAGAAGSFERHWHAAGMQTIREVESLAGAGIPSVSGSAREGADPEEQQHPRVHVSG